MKKESLFLVLCAIGLTPVALTYGAAPSTSMAHLLDIDASGVNSSHIFRAIMGLYLAMAVFWLLGAKQDDLRLPALWSLTVFMLGLAAGRVLSLIVDGVPDPLLVFSIALELTLGVVGFVMARGYKNT